MKRNKVLILCRSLPVHHPLPWSTRRARWAGPSIPLAHSKSLFRHEGFQRCSALHEKSCRSQLNAKVFPSMVRFEQSSGTVVAKLVDTAKQHNCRDKCFNQPFPLKLSFDSALRW